MLRALTSTLQSEHTAPMHGFLPMIEPDAIPVAGLATFIVSNGQTRFAVFWKSVGAKALESENGDNFFVALVGTL